MVLAGSDDRRHYCWVISFPLIFLILTLPPGNNAPAVMAYFDVVRERGSECYAGAWRVPCADGWGRTRVVWTAEGLHVLDVTCSGSVPVVPFVRAQL